MRPHRVQWVVGGQRERGKRRTSRNAITYSDLSLLSFHHSIMSVMHDFLSPDFFTSFPEMDIPFDDGSGDNSSGHSSSSSAGDFSTTFPEYMALDFGNGSDSSLPSSLGSTDASSFSPSPFTSSLPKWDAHPSDPPIMEQSMFYAPTPKRVGDVPSSTDLLSASMGFFVSGYYTL